MEGMDNNALLAALEQLGGSMEMENAAAARRPRAPLARPPMEQAGPLMNQLTSGMGNPADDAGAFDWNSNQGLSQKIVGPAGPQIPGDVQQLAGGSRERPVGQPWAPGLNVPMPPPTAAAPRPTNADIVDNPGFGDLRTRLDLAHSFGNQGMGLINRTPDQTDDQHGETALQGWSRQVQPLGTEAGGMRPGYALLDSQRRDLIMQRAAGQAAQRRGMDPYEAIGRVQGEPFMAAARDAAMQGNPNENPFLLNAAAGPAGLEFAQQGQRNKLLKAMMDAEQGQQGNYFKYLQDKQNQDYELGRRKVGVEEENAASTRHIAEVGNLPSSAATDTNKALAIIPLPKLYQDDPSAALARALSGKDNPQESKFVIDHYLVEQFDPKFNAQPVPRMETEQQRLVRYVSQAAAEGIPNDVAQQHFSQARAGKYPLQEKIDSLSYPETWLKWVARRSPFRSQESEQFWDDMFRPQKPILPPGPPRGP